MANKDTQADRAFYILACALVHFDLEEGHRLSRCAEELVRTAFQAVRDSSRQLVTRMMARHEDIWKGESSFKELGDLIGIHGNIKENTKPYYAICYRIYFEETHLRLKTVEDCEKLLERHQAPQVRIKTIGRRLFVRRDVWPFTTPTEGAKRIRRTRPLEEDHKSVLIAPALAVDPTFKLPEGSIVPFLRKLREEDTADSYVNYESRIKKHLKQDEELDDDQAWLLPPTKPEF